MRDLRAWDDLLRRAHLSLHEWDDTHEGDPFFGSLRDAARQTSVRELAPISKSMSAHAAHLTIARVALPVDVFRAREESTTIGPEDAIVSHRTSISKMLESRTWMRAAEETSTPVFDALKHVREIEEEAARRLGIALTDDASALEFLRLTNDLAREHARDPWSALLAKDATEGWPRAPSLRFVIESFPREASKLADRVRPRVPVPRALGAASHARMFARFGFEIAMRIPAERFCDRQDPMLAGAARVGLLVAATLVEPAFHARVLGCGSRVAEKQARALLVCALLTARMDAARLVRERREIAEMIFVPDRLARVFPLPRRDAPFLAWLAFPHDRDSARDRHDEDWFRNPRFWEEFTIRISSPLENAPGDARTLAAWFEKALA